MADPMQYSGYTYAADLYKQPTETIIDYMQRLAKQRAAGVLGGGGMLDTPEPAPEPITETDPVLGTVTTSCPAGYVLKNGACVNVKESNTTADMPQVSAEERYKGMRDLLDNPEKAAMIRSLMPWGTGHMFLSDNQIEGYVRNAQNEATKAQGFFDYLTGSDGDVVTGTVERSLWDRITGNEEAPDGYVIGPDGKSYAPIGGSGSLVTGQASTMPYSASNPFTGNDYFNQLMAEARANVNTYPVQMPTNFLAQQEAQQAAQEAQLQQTMGMMDTLSQLNSGSISGGSTGYYSDSSGSYTGGADYGGWTGVTADGSGNDWNSF
jgi:hypothetical protein